MLNHQNKGKGALAITQTFYLLFYYSHQHSCNDMLCLLFLTV